ncbi:hypothetical protein [Candidatus Viridilinea mediisalina]|uniref:Uncharacterized protein n=1 Tax=Candidatus Viridilinea mediisalina TaxID=2024553 RepID=A0A2A6RIW2_9CHLR|nr:hypothetical protein [Candidatus Viridilinea mediisalina]PDW03064.1 hypothetical protein CJ255_10785 [Candidatus Viridilinea mediisalina]
MHTRTMWLIGGLLLIMLAFVALIDMPVVYGQDRAVCEDGMPEPPMGCAEDSLTAIYILQFDGYITSTVYLDTYYHETMQALVDASLGQPAKSAILLVDRSGTTPDAIYKIQDGVQTNITAQWPEMTPEVDATDGVFLGNFVWWARTQFPATRTTLSVVGHGLYVAPEMGIVPPFFASPSALSEMVGTGTSAQGLSPLPLRIGGSPDWSDVNPEPSFFSIHAASEMARIGSGNGAYPLDVIDFSQCYGASFEQFYALRNYVHMLTGAPNYTFYAPELLGAGLAALAPRQSPPEMAEALIDAYHTTLPDDEHPHVLVAVETRHLTALKARFDHLASLLYQGLSDAERTNTYRQLMQAAYAASLHYDTTACPPQDWELCPPDALVDLATFLQQLQAHFGAHTPVGGAAEESIAALQAALHAKREQHGTPWFGDHAWDFSAGAGLSLYADLGAWSDASGQVVLNGIADWYTSTVSVENPHPYAFINPALASDGITWADVLHTFWADRVDSTELCIPAFPNTQQVGDVVAIAVADPLPGTSQLNTLITPTVVFSTAASIHNPTLLITITQHSAVVFSETIYLGYREAGTHTVTATHAWHPSRSGPFALTFTCGWPQSDCRAEQRG